MTISQILLFLTNIVFLISTSLLLIICAFFLIECVASRFAKVCNENIDNWQNTQVNIIIPAHNEETVIGSTVERLTPVLKPQDRLIVVADNCNDATAEIARTKGATVIERYDSEKIGKGYALDYGIKFIESKAPDVVVIIDADCTVYPDAIARLTESAIASQKPVQATYLMTTAKKSKSSKELLAEFAYLMRNLVLPLGLKNLGQSCSLKGTGMAFPWHIISKANLANGHIVEDLKLGLDLAIAGHGAIFCPEARVTSYFPQQSQATKSQRTRWEHGHLQMIRTYLPLLLKEAVYQRRFDLIINALDLCVPPLSLLVVIWLGIMTISSLFTLVGASWIPVIISATAGFFFLTAILTAWSGFATEILPLNQLLTVPFYVLKKIPVYLQFLIKPQNIWIRTERDSVS
ncbi:MAG: glycosyltransferase family 2 protein [Calothrix sp. CSU_2_0]|nr:glycosyltransferase family 2 protein [Calothrix sp. CSU_2_0]